MSDCDLGRPGLHILDYLSEVTMRDGRGKAACEINILIPRKTKWTTNVIVPTNITLLSTLFQMHPPLPPPRSLWL